MMSNPPTSQWESGCVVNRKFAEVAKNVLKRLGMGRSKGEYLHALMVDLAKLDYMYEKNREWKLIGTRGTADLFVRRPYQVNIIILIKEKMDQDDYVMGKKWKVDIGVPCFLVNFGVEGGPEMKGFI